MILTTGFKSIRIEVTEHAGYVWFRFLGAYDYEDFHRAVRAMRDYCIDKRFDKAVIDLLAIDGNMPDFDRYGLGIHFAEVWGASLKAAGLAPRDKINRFFENTAVNRQARFQVFSEPGPALAWLQKP